MPTYDYECDGCGHTFEVFQSISEPVKRKCPDCGKQKLRRLFGAGAAIVFKGSGFYQTDYRSESYKKRAKADKEAAKGSKDSGSGDSGSKDSGSKAVGKTGSGANEKTSSKNKATKKDA